MRAFWTLFLTMGLLATVLSVLDQRAAANGDTEPVTVHATEDGTGYPPPDPTPKPPRVLQ